MQIPFFTKKKETTKVFFGLLLKEDQGVGMVIKIADGKITLLDHQRFVYTNGWENIIEDIDQLIIRLENRTNIHLFETIFFVYSHFIDPKTNDIKNQYLQKIKDVVKNLDLKPLGYIECHEAISYYFNQKEDLPLTAVVLELDKTDLSLFVFKIGKKIYSEQVPLTNNLIDDLLSSLSKIKGNIVLPTRIILYNSKDLDEEATKILTYRWSEDLFIQLPKIEILKEEQIIEGMVGIFGEQFSSGKTQISWDKTTSAQNIMGFVIGADIAEKSALLQSPEKLEKETQTPLFDQKSPDAKVKKNLVDKDFFFLGDFFRDAAENFFHYASFLKVYLAGLSKTWLIIIGLFFIFLAIFLEEFLLHKAHMTLFLPYKTFQKKIDLYASISETNTQNLKLKVATYSSTLSDNKETTGKKEIGSKAKGVVTINNFADAEKIFPKDTVLNYNQIKFTLDQEIKVASASLVVISGGLVKQPGKANANVTALEIGPQANLESGKQLAIADLPTSSYIAVSQGAFFGGSKREIRIVSNQDIKDLENKLLEKAKNQKIDQKKLTLPYGYKPVDQLKQTSLTDLNFDKEPGDESTSLNLQAKVVTSLYYYKESELLDRLFQSIKDELPKDFTLDKQKISKTIEKAQKQDDKFLLTVKFSGKSLKKISPNEVIKSVRGKNKDQLEELLKNKFSLVGFNLSIEPDFPFVKNFLPFFDKNITIKISHL